MSCPSCGGALAPGQARCSACGAATAPPVEGALAPKPEPLRELPGLRKKEKTWREEVNERVRSRRKKRESETGLPLFDALGPDEAATEAAPPSPPRTELEEAELAEAVDEPMSDLPLRPAAALERFADEARESRFEGRVSVTPAPLDPGVREPASRAGLLGEDEPARADDEWPLELQPEAPQSAPVERPALLAERLRAGAVDLGLLCALWSVVVYFASRAARVTVSGLLPAWPWLVGYLAFLGFAYAAYFTGTTGQTLGKILFALRVVDTAGQPPGYLRAFVRAALGALGVLAAGLGLLPMAFDPARRALHDRAFRTRVIRG